jgi:hypothetical protein
MCLSYYDAKYLVGKGKVEETQIYQLFDKKL